MKDGDGVECHWVYGRLILNLILTGGGRMIVQWKYLLQDRDQSRVVLNTFMNN
jgi:hypothetical protein